MADVLKIEYFGKTDLLFLTNLIHTELAKYVKAVEGKDLSTNDFTNDLKEKLDDLDTSLYATLSGAEFTGTVKVPTATEGTKDTTVATTAFVSTAVANAIKDVSGIEFSGPYTSYEDMVEKVTEPKKGTIYLVNNGGSIPNVNDEYFYNFTTNKFELFGSTSIDLSNYLKKTDISELETTEVKAVWDSVFGSTT